MALTYSEDQSVNHIEENFEPTVGAMDIDSTSPVHLPEELFQLQAGETTVVRFTILLQLEVVSPRVNRFL